MPRLTLHGYHYSVYTRTVRLCLYLKQAECEYNEVNPFEDPPASNPHPFNRVPLLTHGDFTLYETSAVTRYLDRNLPDPSLHPADPKDCAQMDQVIAIVDAYGYWPMVRQVASQRVFAPMDGETPDEADIAAGLTASHLALSSLETIAAQGRILTGHDMTLADLHLAPMMDYFTMAPEGTAALAQYPTLSHWWAQIKHHPMMAATAPSFTV